MKKSFRIADPNYLQDAITFVRVALESMKIPKKGIIEAELLAEENIVNLVKHAPENEKLSVSVGKFFSNAGINITIKGEAFEPTSQSLGIDLDQSDSESEDAIRSILLESYGDRYRYRNKNGINHVRIIAGKAGTTAFRKTMTALIAGLVFGLLLKHVAPQPVADFINTNIFHVVKTIFMNALKIVIAPVIFFSLATCISNFTNLSDLGRVAAKIMSMYLFTTVIAILVGFSVFYLITPGTYGFAVGTDISAPLTAMENTKIDYSVLSALVGIVPSNFLQPFLEVNTLQIMFLAVLCGAILGMSGDYVTMIKDLFEAFNSFFLTMTTFIAEFIPYAVFCSVALMVNEIGTEVLFSVLSLIFTHILAITIMLGVYCLLILLFTGLNPITFLRKNKKGMITSFSLSSSSAAIPTNIRICTEKLGISQKVCSFSIPLGATVNMDGASILMCLVGLFLARAYAVDVPVEALLPLAVSMILLSLGAPRVPGAALICAGVILQQLNVPIEAMGIVIAVNPILDMIDTMLNTTGDMAATTIVANSEKLLDREVYNNKEYD